MDYANWIVALLTNVPQTIKDLTRGRAFDEHMMVLCLAWLNDEGVAVNVEGGWRLTAPLQG